MGYYGKRNLGDDLLLTALLKNFVKKSVCERISVFVDEDYCQFKHPKIEYISNNILKRLLRLIQSSVLIWGGGTSLYETEDGNTAGLRSLLRYVEFMQRFGKSFWLIGVGIGHLSDAGTEVVRSILRGCDYASFRDIKSLKQAKAILPREERPKIEMIPDLAFALGKISSEQSKRTNHHYGMKIGFCGVQYYENNPEIIRRYAEALKDVTEALKARVYFIPLHKGAVNDNLFHEKLFKALKLGCAELVDYADEEEFLREFRKMDIVIGFRLHSVIMSDMLGIPVMAVNYADKVRSYAESRGQFVKMTLLEPGKKFNSSDIRRTMARAAQNRLKLARFICDNQRAVEQSLNSLFP